MSEPLIEKREEVKTLLRRLFRSENADLDFGIYRIMNLKRKEIEKFIEHDLIEAAEAEFKEYSKVGTADLERELERLRTEVNRDFGSGTIDSEGRVTRNHDAPKIKDYLRVQEEYKRAALTQEQVNDVFNHVYEFFSRYYEDGDFIPKPRYGGREKYFIPYDGKEVVLHWANRDQYYVKTGEYFKKYSFKTGRFRVNFVLLEAKVETNNVKGEKKFFVLAEKDPVRLDEAAGEVEIKFNYRGLIDGEKERLGTRNIQAALVTETLERIHSLLESSSISAILRGRGDEKSLMERHLNAYVDRNTKDFFIHKDLKGFFEREFDFYLKNEVWNLDELGGFSEGGARLIAAKVKAIRGISEKIIGFLSQIEEFQRRLFEKKKLVLKVDYCLTLDLIPEKFYDEISKNENQQAEWRELYRLDALTDGRLLSTRGKKLDADFLKSNGHLVVDTKYFSDDFKDRIMSNFNNLDTMIDGILIKSENYQALNLIRQGTEDRIKCIYIDPPYNTELDRQTGRFLYKDSFEHSSWLCLMQDRLLLAKDLLSQNGTIFISIDENELENLIALGKLVYESDPVGQYIWKGRAGKAGTIKAVSYQHEYVIGYAKSLRNLSFSLEESRQEGGNISDERGNYTREQLRQWGQADRREDRPRMWFGIPNPRNNNELVFPIKDDGTEGRWRVGEKKAFELLSNNDIDFELKGNIWQVYRKIREGRISYSAKGTILDDIGTTADGTRTVQDLFGKKVYDYPKPPALIEFFLELSTEVDDYVLDFFAGSGTTAHAVININAKDGGNRKYVLVEMDGYFFEIIKQRIKKLAFSIDWKEGLPTSSHGMSHLFKCIHLEQYEDALNSIEFRALDGTVQKTLEHFPDYFLSYVLDYGTRDSPTRLSAEQFKTPFNYKTKTISGGEEKEEPVDLIETFNYLLGFHVRRIRAYRDRDRVYRTVLGERDREQIAIIWRDMPGLDLERDKKFIEETILAGLSPDIIYVNGDSYVRNAKPIELEFRRLMGA